MSYLGPFLVVAVVVIVTPGPDTALTIRNTLLGGRRAGLFAAAGVALGQATWTLVTSAGFAALLVASEPIFRTVRYVGAAYLVWLGAQALRAAVHARSTARESSFALGAPGLSPTMSLRQGLISNLTNPKMIAFFPALLPQFAPTGHAAFLPLLSLGMLFSSMTLVWLAAYALLVSKARDFLRSRGVRAALEAATGVVLIGLGLRLASESR